MFRAGSVEEFDGSFSGVAGSEEPLPIWSFPATAVSEMSDFGRYTGPHFPYSFFARLSKS